MLPRRVALAVGQAPCGTKGYKRILTICTAALHLPNRVAPQHRTSGHKPNPTQMPQAHHAAAVPFRLVCRVGKVFPGPGAVANMRGLIRHREFFPAHFESLRQQYGDVVSCYINGWTNLVFRPEDVECVLGANYKAFIKGDKLAETRYLQGYGPGLSWGDDWLRQRRAINPQLRKTSLGRFVPIIERTANELADEWEESARSQQPREIAADMARLSFNVSVRCILGIDLTKHSDRLFSLVNRGMAALLKRLTTPLPTPIWLPTYTNREVRRVERELDNIVYEIIDDEQHHPQGSFLSGLIERYQGENFAGARKELRDQLMSLIIAGYETTGNTLAWTWYLLAQHPEVADRVRDETRASHGSNKPDAFVYTTQVLSESLRLFPPVPYLARKTTEPFELRGKRFPAGSSFDVPVWSVHRHPDHWSQPDRFLPERFGPSEAARHPCAHLPFGFGPRECAGKDFAITEMLLALSHLANRFRVQLDRTRPIQPLTTLVLRPRAGLWANVQPN